MGEYSGLLASDVLVLKFNGQNRVIDLGTYASVQIAWDEASVFPAIALRGTSWENDRDAGES